MPIYFFSYDVETDNHTKLKSLISETFKTEENSICILRTTWLIKEISFKEVKRKILKCFELCDIDINDIHLIIIELNNKNFIYRKNLKSNVRVFLEEYLY